MPDNVTCTSCRSAIRVPADHSEPTIRCGICWAENTLAAKPVAVAKAVARPVAQALPVKPVARPSVVTAMPLKSAPGMAKLEQLIHRAGEKLVPPAAPIVPVVAQPVLATVKPEVAEVVVPAKPAPHPVVAAIKMLDAEVVEPPKPKPSRIKVIEKPLLGAVTPAMPMAIPQAPVPMPVVVPPTVPPVVVEAIPVTSSQPVVMPVAIPSLPVEAPFPITVAPLPVMPAVVSHQPVLDAQPVVQGEFAESSKRPAKTEREKSSYQRRSSRDDDDDDDFDDRRSNRRRHSSGNGSMAGIIIGGVAFLLLLGVGGYFLIRSLNRPQTERPNEMPVANAGQPPLQFNLPNPDANNAAPNNPFGFNPFPNMPQFQAPKPNVPYNWVDHEGDGYKVKLVARPTEHQSILRLHDDAFLFVNAKSRKLSASTLPPAAAIEIVTADVPQGVTPDLKKLTVEPFGRLEKVTACKIAGQDGYEQIEAMGDRVTTTRCLQVGCRVFQFKFIAWEAFGDKQTIEAAKKTYWDSIAITFDAKTQAPVDPNLIRKDQPFGNPPNVGIPGFPQPPVPNFGQPDGNPRANRGDEDTLKLAVRIDPFISAVVFPDRGEAFTLAFRPGSRTAGELRRYDYPDFKLKNTYFLPLTGTFAVGSDKTNRLAITTMAKTDGYSDGQRSMVIGDVHVYDLKPIFDDRVNQREELKPFATIPQPPNTRLVGLEMSPDGKSIYFLGLGRGTTPLKPGKTKLTHADLESGKAVTSLDLPEPAWRIRTSADGKKLYAAEVPVTPTGGANIVPNRATNVVTVDLDRWLIDRTDLLTAGTAFDFLVTRKHGLVASIPTANDAYSLWNQSPPDKPVALDVPGQEPISRGYVAMTPDGKRFVTSDANRPNVFGSNVSVYEVRDWKNPVGFKLIASTRSRKTNVVPDNPILKLWGNFDVTPDGKYAIFGVTGMVIDLTAIEVK